MIIYLKRFGSRLEPSFGVASGLIFAVALAVRLGLTVAFVGLNAAPDFEAQPDQVEYELFAWRLSQGHGFTTVDGVPTACRMPGTSLILAPVYVALGRNYAAGRIWFCLLSAATCLGIAWVGRAVFGAATGLLAAAMLAVYPNHAYYALHFVSEGPFALLVVLASGVTLRMFRGDGAWGWPVAAGVLWGCAALVRPNILLVVCLFVPVLLTLPGQRWSWISARLLPLVAAVLLVVTPWIVRNWLVMGQPILSTVSAYTFWGAHNHKILAEKPGGWIRATDLIDREHPLRGSEMTRAAQAWQYSAQFLAAHRRELPYLGLMKLCRLLSPFSDTGNRAVFWSFALGWIVAGPCLLVGLFLAPRRNARDTYLLACPLLATIATALLYYGVDRFRDSVAPLYLLFGALAIVSAAQTVASTFEAPRNSPSPSPEPAARPNLAC